MSSQAVGPVAMICLLLSSGMVDFIPGQYDNDDPNSPANPRAQHAYNTAAIQVDLLFLLSRHMHLIGNQITLRPDMPCVDQSSRSPGLGAVPTKQSVVESALAISTPALPPVSLLLCLLVCCLP